MPQLLVPQAAWHGSSGQLGAARPWVSQEGKGIRQEHRWVPCAWGHPAHSTSPPSPLMSISEGLSARRCSGMAVLGSFSRTDGFPVVSCTAHGPICSSHPTPLLLSLWLCDEPKVSNRGGHPFIQTLWGNRVGAAPGAGTLWEGSGWPLGVDPAVSASPLTSDADPAHVSRTLQPGPWGAAASCRPSMCPTPGTFFSLGTMAARA